MLHSLWLQYIYLFVTLVCYLSFLWSVIGVFSLKDSRLNTLYNFLKVFSSSYWLLSLFLIATAEKISFPYLVLGLAVNGLCLALFWWSRSHIKSISFSTIFGKDIPESLVTTGPFHLMRHPFYTSYLFCYGSVALVLGSYILLFLFVSLLVIYYLAIKIEEAKFVKSGFLKEFVKYREETNALFPSFTKVFRKTDNSMSFQAEESVIKSD